jgi:hypothetical protein
MRDRSLGVILTILVIFLFGLPGLTCVCLGLFSFLLYPFINTQTTLSPAWTNTAGVFGLCIGIFLVFITVVISYLLLHRKEDTKAVVPAQSANIDQPTPPAPPTNPDEPIPPTI